MRSKSLRRASFKNPLSGVGEGYESSSKGSPRQIFHRPQMLPLEGRSSRAWVPRVSHALVESQLTNCWDS